VGLYPTRLPCPSVDRARRRRFAGISSIDFGSQRRTTPSTSCHPLPRRRLGLGRGPRDSVRCRRRHAPNWRRAAECWTLLDTFSPGPIPNHKSLTLTPNSNADTAIAPMAARRHASAIIIGIPSPTHSFTLGLNPSCSANPPYPSLSFFSFRFHYMDFPDCLLYF